MSCVQINSVFFSISKVTLPGLVEFVPFPHKKISLLVIAYIWYLDTF